MPAIHIKGNLPGEPPENFNRSTIPPSNSAMSVNSPRPHSSLPD